MTRRTQLALISKLEGLERAESRRHARLAKFRLRVTQLERDRYVCLVLERHGPLDRWLIHATIGGMTLTEARALARLTGLALAEK